MAARIKRLWSANHTRGIPTREQDGFRVGERPRSDSIVQCLSERKCGGHAVIGSGQVPLLGANIDRLGDARWNPTSTSEGGTEST